MHAQSLNLQIEPVFCKKGGDLSFYRFFFFFKTTMSGQLASLFMA
ncbi:hypothetical protein HMPREF1417_00508 [Helicobacter pylori GAM260Bi]|nr:hypothetical protein HMPREF1417_00508 [Helicobacter pylori GAM260Bi]